VKEAVKEVANEAAGEDGGNVCWVSWIESPLLLALSALLVIVGDTAKAHAEEAMEISCKYSRLVFPPSQPSIIGAFTY